MFALIVVLDLPSLEIQMLPFLWNCGISLSFSVFFNLLSCYFCNFIFVPEDLTYT